MQWSGKSRIWIWSVPGFHLYNLSLTLPLKVVLAIWFLCLSEQWRFNTSSDYLIIYSARWTLQMNMYSPYSRKLPGKTKRRVWGTTGAHTSGGRSRGNWLLSERSLKEEETSYVSECSLIRAINMSKSMKPNDTYWEITWTNSKTCYTRPENDQLVKLLSTKTQFNKIRLKFQF